MLGWNSEQNRHPQIPPSPQQEITEGRTRHQRKEGSGIGYKRHVLYVVKWILIILGGQETSWWAQLQMAIEHPSQGVGCGNLLEYLCDPQVLIYHTSRYKADRSYTHSEILWQIHEPRDTVEAVDCLQIAHKKTLLKLASTNSMAKILELMFFCMSHRNYLFWPSHPKNSISWTLKVYSAG